MGEREKDAKRIRESLLIPIPRVLSEPRAVLSALCFHGSNNPLGGRYCCSHFTDEKTETFKSSVIYPRLCAPVKVTDGRQKTEESDSQKEEWRWAESEVEREM